MKKIMLRMMVLLISFFSMNSAFSDSNPLPADQAFQLSATAKDYQTILVRWKMAPHYFLYQDRFEFHVLKPDHLMLGNPLYPAGAQLLKTPLGNFNVYANQVVIPVPVIDAIEKNIVLQVKYEGCSQAGYCYPPTTKTIPLSLAGNYLQWVSPLAIDVAPSSAPVEKPATSFFKRSIWLTLLGFFGVGSLLSLTPCVLPMIPILSGILLGKKHLSHGYAFLLSLSYVLGMSVLYALIGVVFGVIGKNIQLAFQNPVVILLGALLFVLMALSMFGVFQLQLPEKLRAFIAQKSDHQKRGTFLGAFVTGALSTLILSPCVTPPLVGALGYISQTGNMFLGGAALFAMGLGSGLPLLLIGALGPKILPKPGRWMSAVKYFIGALLLVVAIMMASRLWVSSAGSVLGFQSVHSVQEIETVVKNHPSDMIMLDFYANWCVSCHELEEFTLQNPEVQKKLRHMILLRVDITDNSVENTAIMQHYGVIAPPTILFFREGKELAQARIIGYQSASVFLKKLPE